MSNDRDVIYWLYLISRGQTAFLSRHMRADLVFRGWIEDREDTAPEITLLGRSILAHGL